jgi:ATP-binding protein involved in chromosome partitioning
VFPIVNLAVGLKLEFPEKEIGLLDADVFGPSLPIMMNLKGQPDVDSSMLVLDVTLFHNIVPCILTDLILSLSKL